jgi:FMN-dependent NADH-azoreductase
MTNILQINTSLFGDEGASSQLADEFVNQWRQRDQVSTVRRDLAREPVPHLTAAGFQAALRPADERTPAQANQAALADELVAELLAADALVIALPMYNFNLPSTLKAWFDHVARAGTTFRYTSNGPEGLLKVEKAYVFATRGGVYQGTEFDFQTPYVKQFLGFLGIDDVEFVYAEGLAMNDASRQKALAAANARASTLAA